MAISALSETDVESIIREKKQIRDDVRWQSKPNRSWLTAGLDVIHPRHIKLTMHLNINTLLREKFTYALFLNGSYRIRALDINGSHKNKHHDANEWISQIHKHKWTDKCYDRFAYTPDDITGSSHEDIFRQFCVECNIDFLGTFHRLPLGQGEFDF